MEEKIYYNWKNFEKDIKKCLQAISELPFKPKVIYGIPRGALILAIKLSYILDIPLALNIFEGASRAKNKKHLLIVDDISDSGTTLLQIPFIDKYSTLTLFKRYNTKFEPNIFIHEIKNKAWVVFPWENTEDVKEERDGTYNGKGI
jgi:hypoxanthine phosphoribosyltransferase